MGLRQLSSRDVAAEQQSEGEDDSQIIAIKRSQPEYRFRTFADLQSHMEADFGPDTAKEVLGGDLIDIARLVRNSLAHNGGKENAELQTKRRSKDHGIPVDQYGYLQILAQHNEQLIHRLEVGSMVITEKSVTLSAFN